MWKKGNTYRSDGSTSRILVTRRGGVISEIVIDTEDLSKIQGLTWGITNGYAASQVFASGRGSKKTMIYLHRFLLGLASGRNPQVDHIDRNRLNCCKTNLRLATPRQNMQNVARINPIGNRYRGVVCNCGRFRAHISLGRKLPSGARVSEHLGAYATAEEAARAYDFAQIALPGNFGILNFPEDRERYLSGEIPQPERRTKNSSRAGRGRGKLHKDCNDLGCDNDIYVTLEAR